MAPSSLIVGMHMFINYPKRLQWLCSAELPLSAVEELPGFFEHSVELTT
jgi:hypothetical protein